MEARITEKQAVQATLEISVPQEAVEAAFEKVLQTLSRQVKVPGFRPGKAPRGVVIQRVGEEAYKQEVREALVDEFYPKAVAELELTPVHAHSDADLPEDGAPFTFTIHAELFPEFDLPDLDAIAIERGFEPVAAKEIEATVARLREEHATLVPVERSVEAGDVVFIETQGEGGQPWPIDLDRSNDTIVAQLVGKTIGESFTLDLGEDPAAPEPEEGGERPHRTLDIVLNDIKAKERPEADDTFAATLGFPNWSAVLQEIERGLNVERARETFRAQRDEWVQKLLDAIEIDLPNSLVRRKQSNLLEDLGRDLQQRGLTLQGYLERLEERQEREKFESELLEGAQRGVKRDIVLERLMDSHGIPVDDAEFDLAVRQLALRERVDVARFRKERGVTWLENFRYLLARDKTLEALVRAKVGPEPSFEPQLPEAAAGAESAPAEGAEPGGSEA